MNSFTQVVSRGNSWIKVICVSPEHWRRQWQPTPVFLPGKSHGQRSLKGYSSWGLKESDTTERLHFRALEHSFLRNHGCEILWWSTADNLISHSFYHCWVSYGNKIHARMTSEYWLHRGFQKKKTVGRIKITWKASIFLPNDIFNSLQRCCWCFMSWNTKFPYSLLQCLPFTLKFPSAKAVRFCMCSLAKAPPKGQSVTFIRNPTTQDCHKHSQQKIIRQRRPLQVLWAILQSTAGALYNKY